MSHSSSDDQLSPRSSSTDDESSTAQMALDLTAPPPAALGGSLGLDALVSDGSASESRGNPVRQMPVLLTQAEERSFTCEVCRKSFKRETNLMFHMATHRSQGDAASWNAPVQCSDCPKVFATKYQAKKHYLRRHFEGERRFACTRCNLKSFAVKEDLTTHLKTCGRTFACECGARPRSLLALNKHCSQTGHTPAGGKAAALAAAAAAEAAEAEAKAKAEAKAVASAAAAAAAAAATAPPPPPAQLTLKRARTPSDEAAAMLTDAFFAGIDAASLVNFNDGQANDDDLIAAITRLVE